MATYNIGNIIENFDDYLDYSFNREMIRRVVNKIKIALKEEDYGNGDVYGDFTTLIKLITESSCSPAIIVLKNKNELFDMFIFKHGITANFNELISSEIFVDRLKEICKVGFVISDITSDDLLNFLKAYYIYREEPKPVSSAQNFTYDYNNSCLEMTTPLEKFEGLKNDYSMELTNIILYADDALPYSLGYLNSYKKSSAKSNYDFAKVLKNVRENKYLGMKLHHVRDYW